MQLEFTKFQQRLIEVLTFAITFGCMALGLSSIPLLPLGLPIIVSFLIAFATFKSPKTGMTAGSFLLAFGLVYHLARINFILILGETFDVRLVFVAALLLTFFSIPYLVESRRDAITVSVGILAATFLFFEQTYYLSIPLILIFAVIYKRARLGLTLSYYISISVPLQIMQYVRYGSETGMPPLYTPLTDIFKDLQESMSQVTFAEIYRVMGSIVGQIMGISAIDAGEKEIMMSRLSMYVNSFPGMITFFVILSGLVSVAAFVVPNLIRVFRIAEITRKYTKYVEMFIPLIIATGVNILFWSFLNLLQQPLAFEAHITEQSIIISHLAVAGITIPVSITEYLLKMREVIDTHSLRLIGKARDVLARVQGFEEVVSRVKSVTPISTSPIEVKLALINDKVGDIIDKSSARFYSLSELDEKSADLDKNVTNQINSLLPELNASLEAYYARAVHEYSLCTNSLKEIGLEFEVDVETVDMDDFREKDIETKIDLIRKLLDSGQVLTADITQVFERIYGITRSLYDLSLPEDSPTMIFVSQKLSEKRSPWVAIDAICKSLYNLQKQYSNEISRSIENLQVSLDSIIDLRRQSERSLSVLGDSLPEITDRTRKAEDIKTGFETRMLAVMKVIVIEEALESTLSIAKDLLTIFYRELKRKEELIENLLPTKGYEWEKNESLTERMTYIIGIISDPSKHAVDELTDALNRSFAYVEECLGTIDAYNQKHDLLLNYPVAELAINELIDQKGRVYARELPFDPRCGEEYTRMYYRQRYPEFLFDETSKLIKRR